jgi:hypothetical protein
VSDSHTVAVGNQAGAVNQAQNAIPIGNNAGLVQQGQNAIAIGNFAGLQYQISNSIILNASGLSVNAASQGFYVAPIASYSLSSSSAFSLLAYGTDNQVIQTGLTYSSPSSIISNSISDLILQSTPYNSWIILFPAYNFGNAYPCTAYGSSSMSITWTLANTGEIDFLNNYGMTGINAGSPSLTAGFNFYNRSGTSSSTLLASIKSTGILSLSTATDFVIGANAFDSTNGWNTISLNNNNGRHPTSIPGSSTVSIGYNLDGGGIINFMNNTGNDGFSFYNRVATTTSSRLLTINSGGITLPAAKGITLVSTSTNSWFNFIGSTSSYSLQQGGGYLYELAYLNSTGTFTVTSDKNSKKNIEPIEPILVNYLQLKPSYFHYNLQEDETTDKSIGLIAQDVAELFNNKNIINKNELEYIV